jgi:glycosyltransferase involved in cell wall biosynthesis/CelD/BcsL family acetyltransferase involved in cellulose biosynthesis
MNSGTTLNFAPNNYSADKRPTNRTPRPLRVLLVVESSGGGTGRHVLDLAGTLAARGCDVHLLYSPTRMDGVFAARLAALTDVQRVPLPMRRSVHPSDLLAVLKVRRYLREHGPFDVIHGHSSKGGAAARLAAIGTGCRAVYTPHGPVFLDPDMSHAKRLLYRGVEVALGAFTARVLAVAPEERRALIAAGIDAERTALVPNGITIPDGVVDRAALRKSLGLSDDTFAFGFVGRLIDAKAPDVLLAALAHAAGRTSADIRLVMVGGGPIESRLRAEAERLGVAGRVIWLGERDASTLYAAFDAFAIASRKEGLPYVVLEAMAASLPVIATTTSGVEILVRDGENGWVVPVDNVATFGHAMAELANDRAQAARFGDASLRRAKQLTVDAMSDGVLAKYRSVVSRMNAPRGAVDVIRGADAERLINDPAFVDEWSKLLAACPWATSFQGHPYVNTWYRSYDGKFEPLLLTRRSADGELQGLLTLAVSVRDGSVIAAGGIQAEYHTWLSTPELGSEFPLQALRALRRAIPGAKLTLHYLASGTPTAWLASREARRYCLIRPHSRPLMRLGDGSENAKSLKKTTNKRKLKQLEKLGPLTFRRVTDPKEFESRFEELVRLYDFRHGAVQGSPPFYSYNGRKEFHLAMTQVPGLLHFTVMEVGGRLAAAHFGVPSGGELQLGMIVHDPFLAKQSPGKFIMLFLAKMLHEEGFNRMDLTPGGDAYKERFANDHDTVHTLTMLPTPGAWTRTLASWRVKAATKSLLARFGYTPFDFKLFVGRLREHPVRVARSLVRQARDWLGAREETVVYRHEPSRGGAADSVAVATTSTSPPDAIRVDAIDDLLKYIENGAGETRRAFLSDALARIEAGQHVYTLVEGDRLRAHAWVCEGAAADSLTEELPGFIVPSDGVVILNARDVLGTGDTKAVQGLFTAILQKYASAQSRGELFLAAHTASLAARLADANGFTRHGSVTRMVRFGAGSVDSSFIVPANDGRVAAARAEILVATPAAGQPNKPKVQKQQQSQQQSPEPQPGGRRSVAVGQPKSLEASPAA